MANPLWAGRTLGVVGGGNMGEAVVRGVLTSGLLLPEAIAVVDPVPRRQGVFRELGCRAAGDPGTAAAADVVLLAVKPQALRAAAAGMGAFMKRGAVAVSIAAGVPLAALEALLPPEAKVVRVMPNTPLVVGRGMSALARGRRAGDADMRLVMDLFAACGAAVEVGEKDLDAVTALSGSGPAYVFGFAEALIAGGAALGLAPDLARRLTVETLRGAAEMLCGGGDPGELRRRVTSPGGTTAAALGVFAERGFDSMVVAALKAAAARGEELGRES